MAPADVHPHAVIFPFPALSHINPMLQLAMKLLSYDFCITFITTDVVNARMSPSYPSLTHTHFRFLHITSSDFNFRPDSTFHDKMVSALRTQDALRSPFQVLMQDIVSHSPPAFSPVSCIIGDVYLPWIQDIADSFNVPRVVFWTTPAHIDLLYLCQPLLISRNLIPFQNKPESSIDCVPGVIPHLTSQTHTYFAADDELFNWCLARKVARTKEALWNLGNNFSELEGTAVETLRNEIGSFLPVGPLLPSAFFDDRGSMGGLGLESEPSQWTEDRLSCQKWLDTQKPSSVIYISFGSIGGSAETQLEELALGVEASGQPFLWAMKDRKSPIFCDFEERTRGQGLVVQWAPQLSTLLHRSVAGFVTHCGWNSIMESLCAGVPMLALPAGFADQQLNAKYVVDEWKLGLELRSERADGLVTRGVVETGVRSLMCKIGDEGFTKRISDVRCQARGAVMAGGSSDHNIQKFVHDVRARASA